MGTLPGDKSLEKYEYYANTRNQFWCILYELLKPVPQPITYQEKVAFLKRHGIATWCIIKAAEREGSSERAIKNAVLDDMVGFLKEHPNIRSIYFLGHEPENIYNRNFTRSSSIKYHRLPSSSGSHTIGFADKIEDWRIILDDLGTPSKKQNQSTDSTDLFGLKIAKELSLNSNSPTTQNSGCGCSTWLFIACLILFLLMTLVAYIIA